MSDAKVAFYRSIGLTGALPDMEKAFFDGRFKPVSYIKDQTGVPVIVVPNGTVATNGTITLGTALPTIYTGGAWIRLPAGAVVGGLAGLYWCVFSSTTVGQVYTAFNAVSSAFTPSIPTGSLVNAVGSNIAYTQTTGSDLALASISIEGGSLGTEGSLEVYPQWMIFSSAGAKTTKINLGATTIATWSNTTTTSDNRLSRLTNRGVETAQVGTNWVGEVNTNSTGSRIYSTVDTSATQSLTLTASLAVATDYVILEGYIVKIYPS